MHWVIFVLLPLATMACSTPENQVNALISFYDATGGSQWYNRTNWGVGDPCTNSWHGVTCQNCVVTSIVLNNNNLIGTIPNLNGLTGLEVLLLYNNTLKGTIPPLTSLINMMNLGLSFNQLTGTIPSVTGLTNMMAFVLYNNMLTGTIPDLAGLSKMEYFQLNNNNLTGTLPSVLSEFTNLLTLYVQYNMLNGTVPFPIPPRAQSLDLRYNDFSCPLPSWCSPAPVGNGLCAPCVNVTSSQLCCFYSNSNSCSKITGTLCSTNQCPKIAGEEFCGEIETSSCNKCFN